MVRACIEKGRITVCTHNSDGDWSGGEKKRNTEAEVVG